MKLKITSLTSLRTAKAALLFAALALTANLPASAQTIYAANVNTQSIATYGFDGTLLNGSLITGLSYPVDLAVSGGFLYVLSTGSGTIGKYNLDGTAVNANLVTGLASPRAFAVSGNDIYVANQGAGNVGHYSTNGAVINADLITGFSSLAGSLSGITVSGNDLYVTAFGGADSAIQRYDLGDLGAGPSTLTTERTATTNELRQLAISGNNLYYLLQDSGWLELWVHDTGGDSSTLGTDFINAATDVVVYGDYVLVSSLGGGFSSGTPFSSRIGLYDLDGNPINETLITAFDGSFYSVAVAVPEPSTYAALAGALVLGLAVLRRRRTSVRAA